ncbi:autotransporter outer membrane beta-barrel domain-containing protein [Legionella sp. MW5194]|uniref:autotransporter outer membrane beta-barrel domain-containing protein n=1 Tax=Legionella sp. MW5194 TaxID=2662448 RepID=UPI00193D561F|nr:autotransporter outer membrane beta-barrel domain-containing protein [Legionella sp. MW5194]QRN04925.1 autotransporter outer membrane beta-barrel domain-containing protein [Legionella sp. MW5194]
MNKNKWLCYACLLFPLMATASTEQSKEIDSSVDNVPSVSRYDLGAAYSYQDFKFDSSKLLTFNRFNGHSNLYGVGGNNFQFNQRISGGFFIYKLDTELSSQLQLLSLPLVSSTQSIRNNSIYAHVLTRLMQHFFFDLAGGYGQNSLSYNTSTRFEFQQKNGYANAISKNWFASVSALFTHTWKEFVFNANLRALRTEVDQDPYAIHFAFDPATQSVPSLTNKVSYLQENAELGYKINDSVQPFVEGGLLQVLDFSNSRPALTGVILGPVPEFNLDMNGYKVGGGIAFNYKQYVFRLEQQYFQRGSVYHSNQSTLSVKMNIG